MDAEDPACCPNPLPLNVRRLVLRPASGKVRISRLGLKARYAHGLAAGLDPMSADTSVQIADASGEVFCQAISSSHWRRPRPILFRFKDPKGDFAGGLRAGKFVLKRSGDMMFRTRGKVVELGAINGRDVLVTVRVGTQCAQGHVRLHAAHRNLIYP